MCGIAGCYQQPDGHKLVDLMTDRIAHRGPDSTGVWSHEDDHVTAQLGFRRLSIIDLSTAADQPMHKDGLTIVYNGELYNYRALRAELAASGVRFRTQCDTEVVLEAWRRWGADALRRFRGMFAFALFDEHTGELVLVRDPFGIKPLYYLPRSGGAVFASELKALVTAVGPELRIEPGALVASMLYYWLPEQRCAIQDVRKLPGGSWALLRPDGTLTVQPYWNIADVAAEAAAGPSPATTPASISGAASAATARPAARCTFISARLHSRPAVPTVGTPASRVAAGPETALTRPDMGLKPSASGATADAGAGLAASAGQCAVDEAHDAGVEDVIRARGRLGRHGQRGGQIRVVATGGGRYDHRDRRGRLFLRRDAGVGALGGQRRLHSAVHEGEAVDERDDLHFRAGAEG